jgi:hypothetical protein
MVGKEEIRKYLLSKVSERVDLEALAYRIGLFPPYKGSGVDLINRICSQLSRRHARVEVIKWMNFDIEKGYYNPETGVWYKAGRDEKNYFEALAVSDGRNN